MLLPDDTKNVMIRELVEIDDFLRAQEHDHDTLVLIRKIRESGE